MCEVGYSTYQTHYNFAVHCRRFLHQVIWMYPRLHSFTCLPSHSYQILRPYHQWFLHNKCFKIIDRLGKFHNIVYKFLNPLVMKLKWYLPHALSNKQTIISYFHHSKFLSDMWKCRNNPFTNMKIEFNRCKSNSDKRIIFFLIRPVPEPLLKLYRCLETAERNL